MSNANFASADRRAAADRARWAAALWIWFGLGAVALLLLPSLRGVDAWFGWLPFWLVVAPAIDLVVLRHRHLRAGARAIAARLRQRRRSARRQARVLRRHNIHARRPLRRTGSTPT